MKKKRILFLFVTLFASTLLYSQVVGVKTNVVMDALKIINLGAEVGLSKKLTLDLYANYNPWTYKDQKMMKMLAFQPELRYWYAMGHLARIERPPFQRTLLRIWRFLRLSMDSGQALES